MLEKSASLIPFYSPLHSCFRYRTPKPLMWEQGCLSKFMGFYFILVQRQSIVDANTYCSIFIHGKGVMMKETLYEANVTKQLLQVLTKYRVGIPSELSADYPNISEILRPGGELYFDGARVIMTEHVQFPAGTCLSLSQRQAQKANEFMDILESACREAADILLNRDIPQAKAVKGEKIDIISRTNLNLPHKYSIYGVDISYCEQILSKTLGTKRYIFQMTESERLFTVYLTGTISLTPKCKLKAYLRDIDFNTIDVIKTAYNNSLPEEFKAAYPVTSRLILYQDLPGKISLCYNELEQISKEEFPLDFNKPVPQSVLDSLPLFITMALALINELGSFRRTALYPRLRRVARQRDKAKGDALLRRIAIMGVGLLIGSSFDMPDTDAADAGDTGMTPSTDLSGIDNTNDTADTNTGTDTINTEVPISQPAIPAFTSFKPGYIVSNPFGDNDMMYNMFEHMHDMGQIDDGTFSFVKDLQDHTEAQRLRTQQAFAELQAEFDEALHGHGNHSGIGPSPEDWDRFDSYENTRADAVDAYKDAMSRGDLQEANRQADIAKDAQLKKEGIYSIQYTPMSLEERSGLM